MLMGWCGSSKQEFGSLIPFRFNLACVTDEKADISGGKPYITS